MSAFLPGGRVHLLDMLGRTELIGVTEASAEDLRRATRAVALAARDEEDTRHLLQALGLMPVAPVRRPRPRRRPAGAVEAAPVRSGAIAGAVR